MAEMCASMRGTIYYRVFHCNSPGYQVIVADVTNGWRVLEPAGTLYLNYLENHMR